MPTIVPIAHNEVRKSLKTDFLTFDEVQKHFQLESESPQKKQKKTVYINQY